MRIFVPSYKRYDKILTYKVLGGNCTYVVMESEKDLYIQNGIADNNILAVEDSKIDSFPKVRQYIIDYAKQNGEDVICQMDDDIERFAFYYGNIHKPIDDVDIVLQEIERLGQILYDLKLGMCAFNMGANVMKYNSFIHMKGIIGQICIYNIGCLKAKYDTNLRFKCDIDFELQELRNNRIIICPMYIGAVAKYDKNNGGNSVSKSKTSMQVNKDYLTSKWGKYIQFNDLKQVSNSNGKKTLTTTIKINVKR